jgi:hypothetical protein
MYRMGVITGLLLAAILVACGRVPAATSPTASQLLADDRPVPATSDGSFVEPGASWLTHIDRTGVSIDYPSSWSVELIPGGAVFVSPEGSRILWEVSPRPLSERSLADPKQWMPNEGGYEIHWSKSVTIPAADGLEFLWGVYQARQWGVAPQLMAVLYSADRELDIRLSTFFDIESTEALAELGPEAAISTHFVAFEQMLTSIRVPTD